jgi:hypothetical protein
MAVGVAGAAVTGLVVGGCISFVFRCSSFVAGASSVLDMLTCFQEAG